MFVIITFSVDAFQKIGETEMQISLAKPPSDNKQKERRRRDQQGRMGRGFG